MYSGNSLQRIPGDTEIFFIIPEIHYKQLHFHSRTFTGSHEFNSLYPEIRCKGFLYNEFPLYIHCTVFVLYTYVHTYIRIYLHMPVYICRYIFVSISVIVCTYVCKKILIPLLCFHIIPAYGVLPYSIIVIQYVCSLYAHTYIHTIITNLLLHLRICTYKLNTTVYIQQYVTVDVPIYILFRVMLL